MADTWRIGDVELGSRLIIGSGKYASFEETRRALDESGAEMITVAVRRVDLSSRDADTLLNHIPPGDFHGYHSPDAVPTHYKSFQLHRFNGFQYIVSDLFQGHVERGRLVSSLPTQLNHGNSGRPWQCGDESFESPIASPRARNKNQCRPSPSA